MKNYKEYLDYCKSLAKEIDDSYNDDVDINDRIHELADGSCYVIYYSKAWDLVNMMRLNNCELLDEASNEMRDERYLLLGKDEDVHSYMCGLAYYLIRNGIHSAYQQIESEVVA